MTSSASTISASCGGGNRGGGGGGKGGGAVPSFGALSMDLLSLEVCNDASNEGWKRSNVEHLGGFVIRGMSK